MPNLLFYIIAHLLTAIVAFGLGIFVLLKDYKKRVNLVFFLFASGVFIWAGSYSLWLLSDNQSTALFWSRMLNIGATLIPLFHFHWILELLKIKKKSTSGLLVLFYLATIFFLFFSFSDLYITGTKSISIFPFWPQMGALYKIYLFLGWVGMTIVSYLLLAKEYVTANSYVREQIKYVFLGSFVGFIGGSTNFPLMLGYENFQPIGSPLVVAYPIIFAYAMAKHRLMDVKIVLRKYTVYILSLISIIIPSILFKNFIIETFHYDSTWIDLLILMIALAAFPSLKDYYFHFANKYLFSSLYDEKELIGELSNNLSSTIEANKIYHYITEIFVNYFHSKAVSILIYKEEKKNYSICFNNGFKLGKKKTFFEDEKLHHLYVEKNQPLIIEELKDISYAEFKDFIDEMNLYGVEVLVPLNLKDKTIGIIALGSKESGDAYNNEDLEMLNIISAESAIAIENALLFEEAKNFNVKLEREVKQATRELRKANEKLKKLDQAKSEFISIASHQLRTPLTVIKGYISMILEDNFGRIEIEARTPLEKVYESNERLIQLVENLLNISRIEAGRLQFIMQEKDLANIVGSVVDELSGNAKKRGLILELIKPENILFKVNVDEEKIRQAILNLIDNSIKYTKEGGIKVIMSEKDNKVQVVVKDTGMGIPPEEASNLFKKFSRVADSPLVNPGGSGLGLFVAKNMVESQGGEIWAESEGEGKGASFCFTLPALK